MADIETRSDLLITGYLNKFCLEKDIYITSFKKFEISLIALLIRFVGNVFIVFDVYPSEVEIFLSEKRSRFIRNHHHSGKAGDLTFGSSVEWTEGIHQISFRSNTLSHSTDAFGITSNIDALCDKPGWFADKMGRTSRNMFMVYAISGGTLLNTAQHIMKYWDFEEGDIITIRFNAYRWTVEYLLNGVRKGDPQKVVSDSIYSPFISNNSACGVDADYQIVYDQTW